MTLCTSCKESAVKNDDADSDQYESFDNDNDSENGDIDSNDADGQDFSDGSGDDELSNDGQGSGGNGAGDGSAGDTEVLSDVVQEAINNILNRPDVRDTLEQTQAKIRNFKPESIFLEKAHWYPNRPQKFVGIKNSIVSEFRRLRENCDPGWRTRVDAGRLNLQRYISNDDSDTAFDVWREGNNEAMDIEAVILVDRSSSMDNVFAETLESMWAIKNSFDKIDVPCTVIVYGSSSQVLYEAKDKSSDITYRSLRAGGGTQPGAGIRQALAIFHDSPRSKQILISITDGDWWDIDNNADEYIDHLNEVGVTTAMLFLPTQSDAPEKIPSHNHTIVTKVENPRSIITFVRDLVTTVIKSNL